METISIDNDIKLLYVAATSFPDGVMAAHQKIHALVPPSPARKSYGVSRPENGGKIAYKAAVEELEPGESEKFNCDTLTLKKGKYLSITIHDYMKDLPAIGNAFNQLIGQPGIDPQGYCVEEYVSDKEVKCMVRLAGD